MEIIKNNEGAIITMDEEEYSKFTKFIDDRKNKIRAEIHNISPSFIIDRTQIKPLDGDISKFVDENFWELI